MSKKLIVFIDSGDTLVNEGTEYRNEGSPIVQSCELIDGAKELLLTLKERGYTIELVADGYTQSFDNSYGQHGLKNIFDARTISEEVGEKKPSQAMFETAMKLLHLTDEDKKRIIMVGNNLCHFRSAEPQRISCIAARHKGFQCQCGRADHTVGTGEWLHIFTT